DSIIKRFGCGAVIASASVATEWLNGKSVEECLKIKNTDIASHLKLPPVKLNRRSNKKNTSDEGCWIDKKKQAASG
ncbi:Iron sulfur cluster assembly protein 1, mitochondrial precursor, partial [Phytophthora palmivora]